MSKDSTAPVLAILDGLSLFRNAHPKRVIEEKTISLRRGEIVSALNEFMECVRYLNTRRTEGTVLSLSSEGDVQDALYLMLRPWVKDLRYEEPSAKHASRYTVPDFLVPSANLIIEAKYIRDKKHGKSISKELHDDIEMYRHNYTSSFIIFFIYDQSGYIPSQADLRKQICGPRTYAGQQEVVVDLIVKP